MSFTQEQLTLMSNREINIAASEKLGLLWSEDLTKKLSSFFQLGDDGIVVENDKQDAPGAFGADYCNDPRDYMPIAIEHDIEITFDSGNVEIYGNGYYFQAKPKAKTGRAVCEAFLMMEIES